MHASSIGFGLLLIDAAEQSLADHPFAAIGWLGLHSARQHWTDLFWTDLFLTGQGPRHTRDSLAVESASNRRR